MDNMAKELLSSLNNINKRMCIIIVILIIALVGTNTYWVWYNSQWEYVVESEEYTIETDGDKSPAILNIGEGDVEYNGENKIQKEEDHKNKESTENKKQRDQEKEKITPDE